MTAERARLTEVIAFALDLEEARGDAIGATKRLAERMGCSPTMMTRYKRGGADPTEMRLSNIIALAEVCQLDPGSLIKWITDGRDAAMQQESRLTQQLPHLQPIDLVNRLKELLESEAAAKTSVSQALDTAALAAELDKQTQSNRLFSKLAAAMNCSKLIELCCGQHIKELKEQQEEDLAELLGLSKDEFVAQFYVAQAALATAS